MKLDPRAEPPPPTAKSLSQQEAKQQLLRMFDRARRPVLIGVAAIQLGAYWTIKRTEELFEDLLAEQLIRRVTADEARQYDIIEGFVAVKPEPAE